MPARRRMGKKTRAIVSDGERIVCSTFSPPLPFLALQKTPVVQKREKISQNMKALDQQMQNLALKTKMASGIWPPKGSELEMVEAAVQTAKTAREVIIVANLLDIFKTVVDSEVCC